MGDGVLVRGDGLGLVRSLFTLVLVGGLFGVFEL